MQGTRQPALNKTIVQDTFSIFKCKMLLKSHKTVWNSKNYSQALPVVFSRFISTYSKSPVLLLLWCNHVGWTATAVFHFTNFFVKAKEPSTYVCIRALVRKVTLRSEYGVRFKSALIPLWYFYVKNKPDNSKIRGNGNTYL